MGSFMAELLLLRKRAATWILLAIAIVLTLFFGYGLPYYIYASRLPGGALPPLLPAEFVSSVLGGFPFYLGILTLILGVLTFGSDYGWDTLKTTLMQRPGRLRLLLAKLGALAVVLALFTIAIFATATLGSVVIALREGAAMTWPSASELLRGLGAGWLILALWTLFGAVLAILSRGTALALGLGILYALVLEGLIAGFGASITLLHDVSLALLRTNAYSLVAPLRTVVGEVGGPGAFSGPFVSAWQALAVLVAYVVFFAVISGLLLKRRDVT